MILSPQKQGAAYRRYFLFLISTDSENIKDTHQITVNNSGTTKVVEQKNSLPVIADSSLVFKEQEPPIKDSSAKPVMKNIETLSPIPDSSLKKKVAAINKWKKQFNLVIGKSSYSSVLLNSGNYNASPITSGSIGAGVNYSPSEVTGNLGFNLGFSLSKKVGEKFEVAFGLQYSFYSTSSRVGNNRQNDTVVRYVSNSVTVDQYYMNAGSNKYNNHFHVLEIPVTVSYKPSVKVPLYLSVGAAYGRLLSTNALTFSNTSNLYYNNKDNYIRNMLPVSSSVQYELFSKKKISLRIGPSVQYNLLKLKKENIGDKPHLVFAGIRSTIIF